MKCKHRGDHAHKSLVREPTGFIVKDSDCVKIDLCLDCGHWLSLGPSNDKPKVVKIEMRAAEIAVSFRGLSGEQQLRGTEFHGWRGEETADLTVVMRDGTIRKYTGVPLDLDHAGWAAGYLAREIIDRRVT